MALQFGYSSLVSLRHIGAANVLMLIGMTLDTKNNVTPVEIDPKQIIFGVLTACTIMLAILLMCVLVAYLTMAAMQSF